MSTFCMDNTSCSYISRLKIIGLLLTGILSSHSASAYQLLQKTTADSVAVSVTQEQIDPLGRSNPKGTVNGLFKALANEDYLRASQYIDFSAHSEINSDSTIISMVRKLEIVLNRSGRILPINIISGNSEGDLNDGLDRSFEEVGSINLEGKTSPILLESITSDGNQKVWLFSSVTTEILIRHIDANNDFFTEKINSNSIFSSNFKGASIGDWLTITFLAIGAYLIAWLFTIFIKWTVRLVWRNFKTSKYSRFLKTFLIPLRLVLAVQILLYLSRYLGVSIIARQAFGVVNLIAMWTALFIFIWLLIDALTSLGDEHLREKNQFGSLSAISFFRNSAKFMLIIIAILIMFDTIGINVTAGLAALGVGGIALALGAQKTIENIIGGLSVVFDQPVSVGDSCKFGNTVGTVEKIGMRSTRIRTPNRSVVTIPNSDFSSQLIENFSKRDLFLFESIIFLRSETSSNQMRYILVELRKILYAHPKVDPDPARVRFLGYGTNALKVEIFAYTHAKDWDDFLAIQEDINLRLAIVIEESGSGFAFPTQTLYLSKDQGLSQVKKEEVENKVNQWIQNNELQLPEFDEQTKAALKGSLTYPPRETDK